MPSLVDDRTLVARCMEGKETAWEQLVGRYEGLVYSTALAVGLDSDDASDVFQYVWLELYRSLGRLHNPDGLAKWLIVATRRQSYKLAAHRRRLVKEVSEEMADPAAIADEQVAAAENRRLLEEALESIDRRCSDLLRLLFISSRTVPYDEVARRTKMAIGSIGPTRARCLTKLRQALEAVR